MEHKRLSHLLILAGMLAIAGCAFIFLVLIPIGGRSYYIRVPEVRALYWPSLIYFWLIGVLCAWALGQYMRICRRIGQNHSFCTDNVQSMKRIALLLFVCAAMLVVYCAVSLHPAVPFGPQLMACVIVAMAFCAMGILAWALHKLLHRAVSLQEENDLTI